MAMELILKDGTRKPVSREVVYQGCPAGIESNRSRNTIVSVQRHRAHQQRYWQRACGQVQPLHRRQPVGAAATGNIQSAPNALGLVPWGTRKSTRYVSTISGHPI
jgi:hypothetical protein